MKKSSVAIIGQTEYPAMIGAIPGVAKQPSGYRISRHCTKFFEKSRAAVNEVNRLSFYAMANDPSLRLCISRPYRLYENRSEEHTSELQSLMRISYAVFCL